LDKPGRLLSANTGFLRSARKFAESTGDPMRVRCSFDRTRGPYARCRYWIAKERLRQLFDGLYLVHYVEHLDAHGEALFAKVCELDLEGIVAKRADSSYKAGLAAGVGQGEESELLAAKGVEVRR
jgi:hypothetical protein